MVFCSFSQPCMSRFSWAVSLIVGGHRAPSKVLHQTESGEAAFLMCVFWVFSVQGAVAETHHSQTAEVGCMGHLLHDRGAVLRSLAQGTHSVSPLKQPLHIPACVLPGDGEWLESRLLTV